jgi:selenocysteine-specific elongation factor
LKDATKASPRLFNVSLAKLVAEDQLVESGPLVFRPGHTIRFSAQQHKEIDKLMSRFAAAPYAPPTIKECQAEVGEDVYAALVDLGQLVPVSQEVVFRRQDYDHFVADVRSLMEERGELTVADARDHFNTSRRYVLALLEHLDAIGVTVRQGDTRKLKR